MSSYQLICDLKPNAREGRAELPAEVWNMILLLVETRVLVEMRKVCFSFYDALLLLNGIHKIALDRCLPLL